MIKFTAVLQQGSLYGFGLSEADLNRLEFNSELILFDFGYINRPDIHGFIVYLAKYKEPKEINNSTSVKEEITNLCIEIIQSNPQFDNMHDLRVFPITKSGMEKFRELPYWGYETEIEITHPKDKQLFFSGRTEEEIEKHLINTGYLIPETKKTHRRKL